MPRIITIQIQLCTFRRHADRNLVGGSRDQLLCIVLVDRADDTSSNALEGSSAMDISCCGFNVEVRVGLSEDSTNMVVSLSGPSVIPMGFVFDEAFVGAALGQEQRSTPKESTQTFFHTLDPWSTWHDTGSNDWQGNKAPCGGRGSLESRPNQRLSFLQHLRAKKIYDSIRRGLVS
jgi:hypothetical protein